MIVVIAFATFISTLVGGLCALRFKDKLHLVLGFSAGAVIGVAFFDLIPESLELGNKFYSYGAIMTFVAIGFVIYLILDRIIFLHNHSEGRSILGVGSLSFHSFLDGVAIGLAFQVSTAIGAIVAVAVLVHDFSDGINTVNLILRNNRESNRAFKWLIIDAVAPVLGVVLTLFFTVPEQALAIVLALFSGFFLYIGASDLIPESHHAHPKFLTTIMTLVGVAVLYIAIKLAGI